MQFIIWLPAHTLFYMMVHDDDEEEEEEEQGEQIIIIVVGMCWETLNAPPDQYRHTETRKIYHAQLRP